MQRRHLKHMSARSNSNHFLDVRITNPLVCLRALHSLHFKHDSLRKQLNSYSITTHIGDLFLCKFVFLAKADHLINVGERITTANRQIDYEKNQSRAS